MELPTGDVARVGLPVQTVDVDRDRHLFVRDVDRATRCLLRRRERYPERGHSLVHQEEVRLVSRLWFAIGPVPDVTLVAYASELVLPGRHAGCIR